MEGGGEGGEGGAFPLVRCQSVSIKGVTVREKITFCSHNSNGFRQESPQVKVWRGAGHRLGLKAPHVTY